MCDGDYFHVHYYSQIPNFIIKEGPKDVHEAVLK